MRHLATGTRRRHLPRQRSAAARRGFTLLEMLMVVVVIGLLIMMSAPRIAVAAAQRDVSGAHEAFASMFRQARASAMQTRQQVTLSFNAGVAVMTVAPGGARDTIGYPLNFVGEFGLTPTLSSDSIVVAATGLVTSGAPFTFTASKRGESSSATITGSGRIE